MAALRKLAREDFSQDLERLLLNTSVSPKYLPNSDWVVDFCA
jgi:hypothetical protein